MPELEQEEPRRSNPLPKPDFESKTRFSSEAQLLLYSDRSVALLKPDKGIYIPIRAYLASAAGPPGAIYSSNRGLLEHPPTVPNE